MNELPGDQLMSSRVPVNIIHREIASKNIRDLFLALRHERRKQIQEPYASCKAESTPELDRKNVFIAIVNLCGPGVYYNNHADLIGPAQIGELGDVFRSQLKTATRPCLIDRRIQGPHLPFHSTIRIMQNGKGLSGEEMENASLII